jgi:NADH:ubiquinone oxidoreductase subunit H
MLPALLAVAYTTVAERKTMGSMQRRLGPNVVGYYGLLQAFADALKLILKEYVAPTQANLILFFLGPIITLMFALLGYAIRYSIFVSSIIISNIWNIISRMKC